MVSERDMEKAREFADEVIRDWDAGTDNIFPELRRILHDKHAAALAQEREECAGIAAAHKGAAARTRREKHGKLSAFDTETQLEITAEERGEDIAADVIATTIRNRGKP